MKVCWRERHLFVGWMRGLGFAFDLLFTVMPAVPFSATPALTW